MTTQNTLNKLSVKSDLEQLLKVAEAKLERCWETNANSAKTNQAIETVNHLNRKIEGLRKEIVAELTASW